MNLDESFTRAKALCAELEPRLSLIETEQDARFQVINRFLTEVLGWDFAQIRTECHSSTGYTDYLISSDGQRRLVIEAKRIGPLLISTLKPTRGIYKVGGPALSAAGAGIQQAASYCLDHGVNYAVVTTGVVWIAFLPFPGAGVSFREGLAYVYPNFDSILTNYADFYDLFSRDGVSTKTYNLHFAKAGGLSATAFEPLLTANRNEHIRMLPYSQLATDLEPIFREFFGSLSGDSDPEMLIACFVQTKESRYADASLDKMIRSISSSIAELAPSSDNLLALEIEAAVESGRGETVVLVGNNGAGKSTFIMRFFDSVLDRAVRARCAVVSIDLLESTGDVASLHGWLTTQIKTRLERLLYADGIPSYEDLQGLYWREYQRWMKGLFKPLYDSDKVAFKIKFSEFLDQQITKEPYTYVLRLLEDVVRNRKLLPCLTFDNGDHFEPTFQEAVFQYSQAIRESIPFTFVVMPITDRSLWRLSKAGPFQTYSSKMFYLPVPSTKDVLEKRVDFLKRKIVEEKDHRHYFLTKGIRLALENIKGFAACLEEVFIKEDFVARRISWLANNNLRKSLELAQKIILSPIFSVEDLVKAFVVHGSSAPLRMPYRKFMQALLHGNYNAFQQDHNLFVLNVFAISAFFPTSPFLNLSILKLLIDRAGETAGIAGYVSVEQLTQYFLAAGISEPALDYALSVLLNFRLIEPYDSSDDTLDNSQRVAITYSGRMHYEMATTDPFFLGDMAFATAVRSTKLVDVLRGIRANRMGAPEWLAVQKEFFEYCFEEDGLYVRLPNDAIYDGQRLLRHDLEARWIEHCSSQNETESESLSMVSTSFSHKPAVVKWYNADLGYGFAEAGLEQDVFFHRNALDQAGIQTAEQGDTLICDIALGPKGKLQAIAIHSVQKGQLGKHPSSEKVVEGTMEFYNPYKGYGFMRATEVSDDVYVSARVLEISGIETLQSGAKVKASVNPGRYGKGYSATFIEIVD
jgi:cold shock CspA family protein